MAELDPTDDALGKILDIEGRPGLQRQLEEYDVLRLILKDIGRTILAHGEPPEATRAAMLTCTKRLQEYDGLLDSVRRCLSDYTTPKKIRQSFRSWATAQFDAGQLQHAFLSFRDAVLLLRDLTSATAINRQMVVMREDVAGLHMDSLFNQLTSREPYKWNPIAYREETGIDLEDLTRSKPKGDIVRPLLHTLVTSDYTFDATLVFEAPGGLTYVPVRGFVDTGSSAFIISEKILERAGIPEDMWQRVDDESLLLGLEGVQYRPTHQVELTWYLDRRRYSRVDTFFVANDDKFDILVPRSLASPGAEGDAGLALMLELRKKSDEEREREKIRHGEKDSEGQAAEEKRKQQRRQQREAELQKREAVESSSNTPGTSVSGS